MLRTYIVTNLLFVKIFFSVPCIFYDPMNFNLAICSVLSLSSWWQQPLLKTDVLRGQNGVMVSDSFAFSKTESSKQHAVLVQGTNRQ